ncbi:MAG TPA: PP2C family protein-serine/threonine phosphatase [Clostridia bacterium]|nr:PP2C family protein-serine/threonine phosphatase [Clostridia bacterium]
MTALPIRYLRRFLSAKGLIPRSLLARLIIVLAAFDIVLYLLGKANSSPSWARSLGVSFSFVSFVLIVVVPIATLRWIRRSVMWRLRNRLIITHIFIGVFPVVLLAAMALLAAFLFASQFSTFVVTSDLHAEMGKLRAANATIGAQTAQLARRGYFDAPLDRGAIVLDTTAFRNRHVTAWYRGKALVLQDPGTHNSVLVAPDALKDDSIVLDEDSLYLRAVTRLPVRPGGPEDELVIVSSVPLDRETLEATASGIGMVALYGMHPADTKSDSAPALKIGNSLVDSTPKLSAGTLPLPKNRLDVAMPFGTLLNVFDWNKGKNDGMLLSVRTRPSLLYARLFRTLGDSTGLIVSFLYAVAIVFAIIELFALIIGLRLTRTMTKSVAALYDATQHINAGNFSHRIKVTTYDQMAALETSFNSMTESLESLIAEQKEKQRIESELVIAQEVQALLFPRDITEVESLEVHGICKPARTVSGDYYDFLPIGPDKVGLAVGDIAGKGISAALLMATVHAFVRAYTLVESVPALTAPAATGGAVKVGGTVRSSIRDAGELPPGTLLAMLNQQLYRSTPTEKYATMFLGFYDQRTRQLTYSNAGHLPPLLISNDGTVRALETGGLVVGLFGDVVYPDDAVEMTSGDIFVAYSDGITEPENEFGEFGEERLIQLVMENRHLPLARISDIVMAAVQDWIGGNEQPDDVTLVLARAR